MPDCLAALARSAASQAVTNYAFKFKGSFLVIKEPQLLSLIKHAPLQVASMMLSGETEVDEKGTVHLAKNNTPLCRL
ncbi:MAG: hypothetical protein QXE92_02595 [Thermofilaceae archaeon]